MSKSINHGISDLREQSGGDVASHLIKIQRQLVFLERKIDSLMHQLQEKQYRVDSSMDKPFFKKPYSKSKSISGETRSYRKDKHRGKQVEKGPDQAFYSRFRKTGGRPGPDLRKKQIHHSKQKQK